MQVVNNKDLPPALCLMSSMKSHLWHCYIDSNASLNIHHAIILHQGI